jgi:hypothetical protein
MNEKFPRGRYSTGSAVTIEPKVLTGRSEGVPDTTDDAAVEPTEEGGEFEDVGEEPGESVAVVCSGSSSANGTVY